MHEPEDDIARGEMSAPAFRAAFAHVAALAAEAENPQLHATLIMMCYTANPTSGRNWRNYYAEGAVQLIAWDCYNHAWRRGTYGTPENLLDRAVATSQEAGLPWGIAELGSLVGSRDPDGSGRAAWLRACGQYLTQRGARFVSYFDTKWQGNRPATTRRAVARSVGRAGDRPDRALTSTVWGGGQGPSGCPWPRCPGDD